MKKSVLTIFGLTAILALTGCSKSGAQPSSREEKASFDIESIELKTAAKALLVGDTYTIQKSIEPLIASTSELVFSSSNSSVASVSSEGVVTGNSQGDAIVTVSSKKDPSVKSEMEVHVFDAKSEAEVQSAILQQKTYQETHHIEAPKKLRQLRSMTSYYYVGDEVRKISGENLNITISQDDGYYNLGGYDITSRYNGAPILKEPFRYQFLTDGDYHSHIFYSSYSNVNNRLYVPTEFYLGTDKTRYDVVCKMMDTLFTSGSPRLSQEVIDDSMGVDTFEDYDDFKIGGINGTKVYGSYSVTNQSILLSAQDKEDLKIPASVASGKLDLTMSVMFNAGNLKIYDLIQTIRYSYEGKRYSETTYIEETFARDDEFEFDLPVLSDYTEVYSINDLF